MNKNIFAVVGVSTNPEKYGSKVYLSLKNKGYEIYPVNPKTNKLFGDKCYPELKTLPKKPEVVITVVPPKVTEKIVKQCNELGIKNIWMQPGSESKKAIDFCKLNNIKTTTNSCIIIFNEKKKNDKNKGGN
jgi:uncharacterized protein